MPTAHSAKTRVAVECAAIVLVLVVYLYPSFKARAQLGPTVLPQIFVQDLSMYLNLSQITEVGDGLVMNPYYRIPVPSNGAGYLKFRLAPALFGSLNRLLDNRTWLAMLLWNAFWWAMLCVVTVWLFDRFLPDRSTAMVVLGLGTIMLFNFGVLKTLLLAWLHLPSLAGFNTLSLPFMRAFIPVIPSVLTLAYLGLQMEALRRTRLGVWIAMAALQLLALAIFPYATLIMAALTAVSLVWQAMRLGVRSTWRIAVLYAAFCAVLDLALLRHGSLGYYDNRSSIIHFQPQLLPHLIGGNWALIVVLTTAVFFARPLAFEVKASLVGLGTATALLMLGDAVVPSTAILLSHHVSHFVHLTLATLTMFLLAAAFAALPGKAWTARWVPAALLVFVLLTGSFLASGNYRGFLPLNRDIASLSRLPGLLNAGSGDLLIARAKIVDDRCGWLALLTPSPVLFCIDAEVMLTPQQNREIDRFRRAIYLYLTGDDSHHLRQALAAPDPSAVIWRLGYWAESLSSSPEERQQGILAAQTDLFPWLERVENHDIVVRSFFRQFPRIIVVESRQDPAFSEDRLESYLRLEEKRDYGDFVLLFYSPK